MSKANVLRQQILYKQEHLHFLESQLSTAKGEEFYTCPSCDKRTKVKNVLLLREHSYVEPYGCSAGDYWIPSQYLLMCFKCDSVLRFYVNDDEYYYTEFVKDHMSQFKAVEDYYPTDREPNLLAKLVNKHR